MSDEKWSVQPVKASPIAADTTLIIDSVDSVSKQTTVGAIADLAVQTPWATDIDGNQFTLSNVPVIAMANDGLVDIEMYRNTAPGTTGILAKIDFDQRKTSSAKATFGSIRMVTNDAVAGTVNAEMQFQARVNDTLTVFMTINETNNEETRFFRPVHLAQTFISFDDLTTPPTGNTKAIYTNSSDMVLNMPSGKGFLFSSNAIDLVTIDSGGINVEGSGTVKEGGTDISPIGPQDIWFDASEAQPVDAGAIATRIVGTVDNQKSFTYVPFIPSSNTFATMKFKLPRNYDNGTLTVVVNWTTETEGAGDVIWGVAGVALTDGDDIGSTAFGTEITVTDTQSTINFSQDSPRTGEITLAGTPADSDTIFLRIRRLGADGGDTFPNDVQLMGMFVQFETDEAVAA